MAVELLGKLKDFWTGDAIQQLSVMLDEQPDHVVQALSLGAPAILAGLLQSATGADARRLVHLVKNEPEEMARFGGLTGLLEHLAGLGDVAGLDPLVQYGRTALRSIFGDKLDRVLELIGTDSGAKSTTVAALMSLLVPTLMGMIRKETAGSELSPESLREFLTSQRDSIVAHAPGNLASTLGVRGLAELGTVYEPTTRPAPATVPTSGPVSTMPGFARGTPVAAPAPGESNSSPASWWAIPVALGVLALAAGYFLLPEANPPGPMAADEGAPADLNRPAQTARNEKPVLPTPRADVTEPAVTADGRPVVETGARRVSMALPNDAAIDVPEGSYLEAAVKMLRDDKAKSAQTFTADGVTFNQDSSLTTESAQSVEHLAKIATAYPKSKIKIEAREAPGGPDDKEQRRGTAQKRADAFRDVLVQSGLPAERVTAEVVAGDALDAQSETKKAPVDVVITPE